MPISSATTGFAPAGAPGRWCVNPGAHKMRGAKPTTLSAARRAWTPSKFPVVEFVPPITLAIVSVSVPPAATRTTITTAPIWSKIPSIAAGRVPVAPSLAASARLPAIRTGVFSGNGSSTPPASAVAATAPTTPEPALPAVLATPTSALAAVDAATAAITCAAVLVATPAVLPVPRLTVIALPVTATASVWFAPVGTAMRTVI